uniref:Uncharacterized protein n=1 Tax=Meloidogyne enterolobii TaxID=390850 RepID=A0A6V7XD40_MELEN|nr:unnamed protein product [Meloidogyne enterolobii]
MIKLSVLGSKIISAGAITAIKLELLFLIYLFSPVFCSVDIKATRGISDSPIKILFL